MGNFNQGSRGGNFNRGRSGGRNFGGGRGFSHSGGGRLPMVDAVCDECGENCKLPFKPTGNKPVYCSNCFEKNGKGRDFNRHSGRKDFGGRDRQRPDMYDVVCDNCGNDCQVPFKPRGDKDIFCSDCFEDQGNQRPRGNKGYSQVKGGVNEERLQKQLDDIQSKLDIIMEALELVEIVELEDENDSNEEKSVKKEIKEKKTTKPKKKAAKKTTKKKSPTKK